MGFEVARQVRHVGEDLARSEPDVCGGGEDEPFEGRVGLRLSVGGEAKRHRRGNRDSFSGGHRNGSWFRRTVIGGDLDPESLRVSPNLEVEGQGASSGSSVLLWTSIATAMVPWTSEERPTAGAALRLLKAPGAHPRYSSSIRPADLTASRTGCRATSLCPEACLRGGPSWPKLSAKSDCCHGLQRPRLTGAGGALSPKIELRAPGARRYARGQAKLRSRKP
jgi:hypothetical protein